MSTAEPMTSTLSRSADLPTSVAAAMKAKKASGVAVRRVMAVMEDGKARHDEAIHAACRFRYGKGSADLYRHARKALSEGGWLVADGIHKTSNDADSVAWRKAAR